MSEDKKEGKKVSKEEVKELSFLISDLTLNPWPLFGIYYPVFQSAVVFAGLNETDMVTKTEMQKHIDNYMNHPVKG